MDSVPFTPEDQLCHKLHILVAPDQTSIRRLVGSAPKGPKKKSYLPGQPRIALDDAEIGKYLDSELVPKDLDKLAPHLWLVAKQDSSHISSLTDQIVRGREIIVTEKPELHLVWIYNRVYIKPIPQYLLSHAFWKFYLVGENSPMPKSEREEIRRAALGFLRSYLYLIRHKSDFILATDNKHRLVPKQISYSDFIHFILTFDTVQDINVTPRYNFGELRLTRLNFWSKIFLGRFTYQKTHHQYGAHFAQFYAPLLFVFGVFSLALNAMQVILAYPTFAQLGQSWVVFANTSRDFSIYTLVCVVLVALLLISNVAVMFLRETVFALGDLYRKRMSISRESVSERISMAQV